jgi:predicted ATPase
MLADGNQTGNERLISRTAVRRQQTLRASVDWSHALLTQTERILFRRLAVFLGGFDRDAAQAVAGADGVERYQVLDQLTLLVDKSLVVAGPRRSGCWKLGAACRRSHHGLVGGHPLP